MSAVFSGYKKLRKTCLKKLKNTRRFDVLGRHYQVFKKKYGMNGLYARKTVVHELKKVT